MSATLLIRSLSFVGFLFESVVVGFDVSQFLAIVADSVVPGTCSGFADCLAVGKNFFPSCSIGRSNLVLHKFHMPSLWQKTFSELLQSGVLNGSC